MAKTIYIAGLGLIGASMALGIKRDHPDYEILGYNRSQTSRDIALERGIIDRATDDFASFAPLADVIILTLPIKQTIAFIQELAGLNLKEGVIISDAGSTKASIVEVAEEYLAGKSIRFVGAHPMAGSHKTGAASADVNLFENAYYIFTPSSLTSPDTIEEMKNLLSGLHARFIEIDAKEHDRVTSQISHFPHILASGLMEQTAVYAQEHEMTRRFAAGGFRDMTRIAESEPGMWTSILLSNRETILERIEDFKERLDGIGQAISKGEEEQIWNFFNQAREQRQAMEIHKRGGVDSSYDLYVDVPDEEDVILRILELLRGTSLVNIHINEENREDIHGILQISFKNAQDLERAERLISENTDYTVVIK
ncbi:prephenate dehydrogenase [Streptococcus sp. oral taxon 071 str. 73H25AP]|uniref:prephenate dehydrogenase n=1 Tax=Streptococcus sp. oral taxon 071 TaxID=712630 RepID=UPI0001E0FC8C|nr:prephenate dehydrogenase [Streptococcus sp. oral taxon 071]EFM35787.1 prephenate dehydrogenase [Streptococcus sp. oral taxon 071 str. 73H25AP]